MPLPQKSPELPSGSGSITAKRYDGQQVTKALFQRMLAEEMQVIQQELGEQRFSSGRFHEAAALMEKITTQDELIDFLTLPGYALLA